MNSIKESWFWYEVTTLGGRREAAVDQLERSGLRFGNSPAVPALTFSITTSCVRVSWPHVRFVPRALMALPPQTANDRGERWHKIKGKALCSVCLSAVYLSHRRPPHPSNPLLIHLPARFDHQSGARRVFIGRHYRK